MKRMFALFFVILILSISNHAFAVCDPGSNWTAQWTDSFGQTTYTIEAPCKVYIGTPFTITATVTDATCPDANVGFGWAIRDNGTVIRGGGFNWITTVGGQWQQVIDLTYAEPPIDHLLEFMFTDLGQESGAHWWASNLIGNVTVDPYPNADPVVDAGPDVFIASADQNATIIKGSATDNDNNPLFFRWLENGAELQPFSQVDASVGAPLDLRAIPFMSLGSHTFTLEVSDGIVTVADTVVVSVANSKPIAAPFAGGTFQAGDAIPLSGNVSDYDGDMLSYRWVEGTNVLAEGAIVTQAGGAPVQLPEHILSHSLQIGSHTLVLELNDGINMNSASSIVNVIDTKAPTLAPVASTNLLWPPNKKMTEVRIKANAHDNSGGPVMLSVLVTTSAAPRKEKHRDKHALPAYEITRIDQSKGLIVLRLRNGNGSGSGSGKEVSYSVAVTATDATGNASTAEVLIKTAENMGRHSLGERRDASR